MKVIQMSDYSDDFGLLIDLDKEYSYNQILNDHKKILNKNKKYYITCQNGIRSKRLVQILEIYGYNVCLVIKQ